MPKCEQIDLSPGQSWSPACRARPELAKVVAHQMHAVVEVGMDKLLLALSEQVIKVRIPAKLNSHSGQREHPDP